MSVADLLRFNPCPTPDEGSAVASTLALVKLAVRAASGEVSLHEAQYEVHRTLTALATKDDARKRLERSCVRLRPCATSCSDARWAGRRRRRATAKTRRLEGSAPLVSALFWLTRLRPRARG